MRMRGSISIDTEAARKAPGVFAVWTAADVAEVPPIDFRLTRIEGLEPYRQPILAKEARALCRSFKERVINFSIYIFL